MLSLRDLQRRFVDGILGPDGAAILPAIVDHGLPAAERLAIYRNNCREGFHDALATGYPVLRRLTGEAYFRQLAREYQRALPSPSGNLFHAGERLPEFLQLRFRETSYEYFVDVARLEWCCQAVLIAAAHGRLDPRRLAAVDPADHAALRFAINPGTRLTRSVYPVVLIWEAHQSPEDPEPIDLGVGGEQAIVRRCADGIRVGRLSPAEYACLDALQSRETLGVAAGRGLAADPGFDLSAALRRWLALGLLVDFTVAGAGTNLTTRESRP